MILETDTCKTQQKDFVASSFSGYISNRILYKSSILWGFLKKVSDKIYEFVLTFAKD